MNTKFQSGYIAIIGRPNVGKSTLLNAFLGQKIASVSAKPQMTRHRILGIKTVPGAQMLFLDTPGIHRPHRPLNEHMMEMARTALDDADIFLFVIEPGDEILRNDREIFQMIANKHKPILILINKADKIFRDRLIPQIAQLDKEFHPTAIIPMSALKPFGLEVVEKEILKLLPEGPVYYPEDQVTDQNERFIICEIIREKIMDLTKEEIPYSVTVQIETYEEPAGNRKHTRIRAVIITEKDSQKGILVGKGGQMIRKIGELSRKDIEVEIETPVFLELFVRVEDEWSKDPRKVEEFAYSSST